MTTNQSSDNTSHSALKLAATWVSEQHVGYRYNHGVRARVSILPAELRQLLNRDSELKLPAEGIKIRRSYGGRRIFNQALLFSKAWRWEHNKSGYVSAVPRNPEPGTK